MSLARGTLLRVNNSVKRNNYYIFTTPQIKFNL